MIDATRKDAIATTITDKQKPFNKYNKNLNIARIFKQLVQ